MMVKVECGSCGGTGLYQGFMEPKGEAVVCLDCDGAGGYLMKGYEGRRKKPGSIKLIRYRASKSIMIPGSSDESMTYKQFLIKVKELE